MMNPPGRKILATLLLAALGACESSTLPVDGAEVAEIRIAPQPARVELASSLRLDAQLLDAAGNPVSGRPLFWASENTQVATVSPDGEVTGVGMGSTRVAASAEGMSGVVTVNVVPRAVMKVTVSPPRVNLFVGGSATLSAAVLDRTDQPLSGRAVAWTSSEPNVASVSASGAVSARAVGTTVIRAASEGVSGEATVVVGLRPVATVEVSPSSATLIVGASLKLSGTARADDGTALDGREFQWSSGNSSVVAVAEDGTATAMSVGVTVVTALVEGKTGSATLTVSVRPVATVELSPPSANLFVAGTQQFTATPRDSDGAALTGRSLVWSIGDAGIARVDGNGLVTGVAPGQTSVTATVEGKTASAAVTVTRAPVATVEVNPATGQIVVGGTRQLVAVARDAGGRELTGREVTWSSSAPGVATVNGSGLATGVAAGPVTFTATVEGKSGSAQFVVAGMPVATVEVTPAAPAIFVGATQQLAATLRGSDGTVLTGRQVSWTSSAPTIASVNGSGVVYGAGAGQATITATAEGISGSATVTVTVAPVATVEVTPPTASVAVGATQQLTVVLKAADGTVLTGRTVTWTSSQASVASVSNSGLVTGQAAGGPVTITATSEGKSDTAAITVFAPVATVTVAPATAAMFVGATQQFTATLRASNGNVLTGRTVTWSSTAPSVASVNSSTGLATANAVGQASIIATSEGKADTALVTVTLKPVQTVEVTPTSSTIAVGATQQLTATLKASDGTVLTGRTVTWASSSPAVASVGSSTGLVSGVAAGGPVTITATSEGKNGTASVTVFVPVGSVEVTPPSATLTIGGTQQFSATVRSAGGTVLTGRTVTWSSTAPSVATVNNGLATAVAAGQASIIATSEGKADTASVTVTGPPVATVEVTPSSAQILLGGTQQLTATLRASNGTVLTGRTITWTSSAPSVASVSTTGLVTSHAAGQATITATSEGRSDTSAITVLLPVATVTVSPSSFNLKLGDHRDLDATARAANGTVLNGRTVTWTSSNPLVATVNSSGRVNAILVGQATITATIEGVSGSSSVTVTLTEEAVQESGR
jgi:uncharacterized protein YjdB